MAFAVEESLPSKELLPLKGLSHQLRRPCLCFRRTFELEWSSPLPLKDICHRRALIRLPSALDFVFEGSFRLCQRPAYNASNYSIVLTAATCSDLDSLLMQHPPTQPYRPMQDSSDCEKRGCLLVTVIQFALSLRRPLLLPSKGVCHRRAFAIEERLPSNGVSLRMAFAIVANGFCLRRPGLCHRRS